MNEKKFKEMQTTARRLRAEADKAAGALETTMARLRNEFDVDTIEEAEELLDELTATAAAAENAYDKAAAAFEEKWHEHIQEDD